MASANAALLSELESVLESALRKLLRWAVLSAKLCKLLSALFAILLLAPEMVVLSGSVLILVIVGLSALSEAVAER